MLCTAKNAAMLTSTGLPVVHPDLECGSVGGNLSRTVKRILIVQCFIHTGLSKSSPLLSAADQEEHLVERELQDAIKYDSSQEPHDQQLSDK